MLCSSRHLAMYKESESILKEVLAFREKQHGEDSVEVADALNDLEWQHIQQNETTQREQVSSSLVASTALSYLMFWLT